jgi:ADP-ribosylglycohydrolase
MIAIAAAWRGIGLRLAIRFPYHAGAMSMSSIQSLPPPLPNSYWVQPGRLLAGEYPGSMSRADAMERVQRLLRAGLDSFVDLTEEGELPEYNTLLPGLTEQQVRYQRLPILDHGLPESDEYMARILDRIDGELAAGHNVYVHCYAGIGRTGMAMACHLIRHGLEHEDALARLQALWQQCARSRRWPTVPETAEQVDFVRQWRDSRQAQAVPVDVLARYQGALVGLAVGDALGTLVARSNFDAATLVTAVRDSSVLATGASTATVQALAHSLLAVGAHDAQDQMQRYLQWTRHAPGEQVPAEMKRALAAWQWSKKPNAGSHDPQNLDPHSLARTVAVALYLRQDAHRAIELAAEVSRTTQQAPLVLDLCRLWAGLLIDALCGVDKEALLAFAGPATRIVRARALKQPLQDLIDGQVPVEEGDARDAMSVTRVALAGFAARTTWRETLIHVETAWRPAPAAAALCGALAGAYYGLESIPAPWRQRLPEDAALRSLARHLVQPGAR